jgi:hypothetical protein
MQNAKCEMQDANPPIVDHGENRGGSTPLLRAGSRLPSAFCILNFEF